MSLRPATSPTLPAPTRLDSGTPSVAWKPVIGIKTGDRPLVVWIADASADASVGHRTFDDASVRLASRAFRTVRITPSAARSDSYLARYAGSAPAMVVFSPGLTRANVTQGPSLDARTALDAMRVAARADLGLDLDAAVARARALTAEEQTASKLRADLRRTAPNDAVRAGELDRRLAAIRTELAGVFRARAGL